jgi:hypothetical protein
VAKIISIAIYLGRNTLKIKVSSAVRDLTILNSGGVYKILRMSVLEGLNTLLVMVRKFAFGMIFGWETSP